MLDHLRSLSIEKQIGQLFFIGIAGPDLDDDARELLSEVSPGGVCLFARNIREREQTRPLLDSIRSQSEIEPFLSVDQEGGLVDRLRRIMTPMPAAGALRSTEDAALLARIIAETLRMHGFNMDFAPVVDVVDDERAKYSNGLFSRAFGRSREDVAAYAGAFLRALQKGGITGCLKHFPGLGAAQVDSHEELPVVDVTEAELRAVDLFPYRELLAGGDIRSIMAAHASFPNVNLQEVGQNGKLLPSSLSYGFITTLLRGELAFDGLVITDDLEMGAIINNYGIGEACKMAIGAGVDMLAICADADAIRAGYDAVLDGVTSGEIPRERIDESLVRIAHAKNELTEPLTFDPHRLDQLTAEIADLCTRSV